MNRYYTDENGNRCEISKQELETEIARLNARPEHQEFIITGIRSGTDEDTNGVVTIRSTKGRLLGSLKSETYKKYVKLVGAEEARNHIECEGLFGVDWDAFVAGKEKEA